MDALTVVPGGGEPLAPALCILAQGQLGGEQVSDGCRCRGIGVANTRRQRIQGSAIAGGRRQLGAQTLGQRAGAGIAGDASAQVDEQQIVAIPVADLFGQCGEPRTVAGGIPTRLLQRVLLLTGVQQLVELLADFQQRRAAHVGTLHAAVEGADATAFLLCVEQFIVECPRSSAQVEPDVQALAQCGQGWTRVVLTGELTIQTVERIAVRANGIQLLPEPIGLGTAGQLLVDPISNPGQGLRQIRHIPCRLGMIGCGPGGRIGIWFQPRAHCGDLGTVAAGIGQGPG